ncbi:MAG TPA: NlpC/P60 family protein [Actinomycetota bacterium]|nr:NlpC/P60 family protein [Actinomycetota bacterium]
MRVTRKNAIVRIGRVGAVSLVLASLTLASADISTADPRRDRGPRATREFIRVTNNVSLLVEEYDRAKEELKETRQRLEELRATLKETEKDARTAQTRLAARVGDVYRDNASQLAILLGSSSLAELGDRAAFLSGMVGDDADLITTAKVKSELARRAEQDVSAAVQRERELMKLIKERATAIRATEPYQQSLSRVAGGPAEGLEASAPSGSGAGAAVVRAAMSKLGSPYSWGAAGPNAFDCSGFTMWAWSQVGVSLPHSSSMQYSVLPKVSMSQLQLGDLIFSYSPIHHVGIYIGGGNFIHSPHSGDVVKITAVAGYPVVGAARPG